ncbi:MAG: GtrA family protein [Anaerolineales bacterium]
MLFNPKQTSTSFAQVLSTLWLKSLAVIPAWVLQILRFGVVGVLNTLVDAGVYFVLSRSGLVSDLVLAKSLSYAVGILHSFYWNKSWTFRSDLESRRVIFPFVVTNLLAVGLNTGVMRLALGPLGWSEVSALTLATMLTFAWNFVTNKFYIFKGLKPT